MLQPITYTDKTLVLLVSQGDESAFRLLFDQYRNKIFSIAWKIIGIEAVAEDVVQEVFIKLWLNKDKLAEVENLNAYINTITRNHIFNNLRKVAYEQTFIREVIVSQSQNDLTDSDQILYNELQALVHKAIQQLPSQQKRVYHLSRAEGLKHEEIAEIMKISRSTVKGHMVEALRSLKKTLKAHMGAIGLLIMLNIGSALFTLQ